MTNVTCPGCRLEVRVDLSRVPAGRTARVACPSCKATFPVAGPEAAASAPPAAASPPAPAGDAAAQLEALRAEIEKSVMERCMALVMGALGPGSGRPAASLTGDDDPDEGRPALACDADPQVAAVMAQTLSDMGYSPQVAHDLKTAWRLLDRDQRLVVLGESLQDDAQGPAKILDRLSRLPGSRRRRMFVAAVGTEVRTGDGGLAFVLSANMTIHRGDLGRLGDLLRRGLNERDKLYRPFLHAMEAASSSAAGPA